MNYLRIAARMQPAPSIYVDLDETLVHSLDKNNLPENLVEMIKGLEALDWGRYITLLRPGVKEFLDELSSLGDLFICTAASRSYAVAVLSYFGLMEYFVSVYSMEDIGNDVLSQPNDFILIDNLPTMSGDVLQKLHFLGVPDYLPEGSPSQVDFMAYYGPYHVEVSDFTGDTMDAGLQSVIPMVKQALELGESE